MIPIVAKVFERIVYDQLYAYLEEHDILYQNQSGFRATHSTVTALLEATDSWAYNIDNGKINGVIFLDLKKAFDTVDHQILLSKLNYYGIHGKSFKWFQSYLENRTQKCSVNGSLSSSCSLTCGVPQGTILGPLLFLLYINDLPNCLSNCEPVAGIGCLKRVRHLIPASTLHLLYQALVKPHFDYCDIVWGSCGITLRGKLQKLQIRAARVLTFSS